MFLNGVHIESIDVDLIAGFPITIRSFSNSKVISAKLSCSFFFV